tara:strand:+ start:405 stop:599 length:195 start_codon:yes stop_codon:yes gene_type:complete
MLTPETSSPIFDVENAVLKYAESHEINIFDEWTEEQWEKLIAVVENSGLEEWSEAQWEIFKSVI